MSDPIRPYEPLTSENAALVLVDHQVGLMTGVRDYSTGELKHNVVALAKAAGEIVVDDMLVYVVGHRPHGGMPPEDLRESFEIPPPDRRRRRGSRASSGEASACGPVMAASSCPACRRKPEVGFAPHDDGLAPRNRDDVGVARPVGGRG